MSKPKSWFIRPNIHAPGTAYVVDETAKEIAFCQTEADAERIVNVSEAVRKAIQLATIAIDWNLDEVEIDGEMVNTYRLREEFQKAFKKATA